MKRAIINGKYVKNPTAEQLSSNVRFGDAAEFYRNSDQDEHYVDMIQPYMGNKPNPEFVKAYPERARDYFTDEELKEF